MPQPQKRTTVDDAATANAYARILAELKAQNELPPSQWVPQQPPNPGYAYSVPDPMAQAAHFAQRQEAARQLSSPVSPVLDLPEDYNRVAPSPLQVILQAWQKRKK